MAGVKLTVFIAFVGLVGGFVVGVIAGMFRAYGPLALNVIAQVYIELIRGTPIVVQVMFLISRCHCSRTSGSTGSLPPSSRSR
jgi:amine acid ABC transporter, permease protein, 3-TM region, His/Glu/Gln/Arg/opine family